MKIKKPVIFNIRGINPDIWEKFKVICLRKHKSANQFIKELIKREVDKSR